MDIQTDPETKFDYTAVYQDGEWDTRVRPGQDHKEVIEIVMKISAVLEDGDFSVFISKKRVPRSALKGSPARDD